MAIESAFSRPRGNGASSIFSNGNGNGSGQSERRNSKVWINLGVPVNGKFISLPGAGIAIDTMQKAEIRGQNQDFIKTMMASNEILEALQAFGDQLKPGQEEIVYNLEIRMRRVNDAVEIAENEFSAGKDTLLALFTGAKKDEEGAGQ